MIDNPAEFIRKNFEREFEISKDYPTEQFESRKEKKLLKKLYRNSRKKKAKELFR